MSEVDANYVVTLENLVESHYRMRGASQAGDVDSSEALKQNAEIRRQFSEHYGTIKREYYSEHQIAAVVLTNQGYLGIMGNIFLEAHTRLNEILVECSLKARKAYRLLKDSNPESLCATNEDYYAVAASILAYLDKSRVSKDDAHQKMADEGEVTKMISDIMVAANETLDRSLTRMAKTQYFIGMMAGARIWLGAMALMIGVLVVMYYFWAEKDTERQMYWNLLLLAVCFFSGGLGALVSVMSRMGLRRIELDTESGHVLLRRLGLFRVLMGAILGMGLYALVRGQVIPLNFNVSDMHDELYAYAGIAFLAGFAERWAQDMLSVASNRLGGSQASEEKK